MPIGLLFFFAVIGGSVFVKPVTAMQWLGSTLTLMIGGIATIWFGFRHDVSAFEALASGALVIACVTLLVMIGRRSRRSADRRAAADLWAPPRSDAAQSGRSMEHIA